MSSHLSRIFEDMEIKECAYSRFKDDNKEKAKHVDAPCENKRHAGSTPATSTIFFYLLNYKKERKNYEL